MIPSASRIRYATAAIALAATCAGAWLATPTLFDLDDAYIVAHSAQVAVSRRPDPVFQVPALVGITSPAYLALVMCFARIGLAPLLALRLASALGTAALACAIWSSGLGLTISRRILLIALTIGAGLVLRQSANGLETGWAMAITLCLLISAEREQPLRAAVVAGILPWVRPDLAPIALAGFAYGLRNASWRVIGRAILWALAIALPFGVWLRVDTGYWLPQSMHAKRVFFASGCRPMPEKGLVVVSVASVSRL